MSPCVSKACGEAGGGRACATCNERPATTRQARRNRTFIGREPFAAHRVHSKGTIVANVYSPITGTSRGLHWGSTLTHSVRGDLGPQLRQLSKRFPSFAGTTTEPPTLCREINGQRLVRAKSFLSGAVQRRLRAETAKVPLGDSCRHRSPWPAARFATVLSEWPPWLQPVPLAPRQ